MLQHSIIKVGRERTTQLTPHEFRRLDAFFNNFRKALKRHRVMELMSELLKFTSLESRLDLKVRTLEHILGMTGNSEGKRMLLDCSNLLKNILDLTKDSAPGISRDACLSLVNLSADEEGADTLLSKEISSRLQQSVVSCMRDLALDPDFQFADAALMVLSNLSRPSQLTAKVLSYLVEDDDEKTFNEKRLADLMERLLSALTATRYNSFGSKMHYLGPLLSNLSQIPSVRRYLLDHNNGAIHRLLPFTEFQDSLVRRGGVVGTLRNCCFESDEHSWLLSPEVDILPRLLLPLAGPEEFDEEDNNKLPIDLQWLPEDKKREEDPDIRRMLLEALEQLCAKRINREFMRNHNVYIILRELHKWEKDRQVLLACENLVDLLIRNEDEIGEEDLHSVEVPDDMKEKFTRMDEDFLKSE